MNTIDTYIIQHQSFSKEALLEYCLCQLEKDILPSWEADIWLFIQEWLNDELTVTLKTSGSTGTPKQIKVEKQFMRNSAQMTLSFLDLKPQDTALLCLPAAYIAGKMMIVRAFEGQMNLIYAEPSGYPLKGCDANIDFAAMIPLQVENTLNDDTLALSNINHLIIGGAAVSGPLAERLLPLGNNVWATYGMTETVSHVALKKLSGAQASDFFSSMPGVSLFKDERGCLAIDAPHLAETTVHTNDMVDLSDEGQFRFIGRYDNVINTGGVKVVPEQLEAKIKEFITDDFIISSEADDRLGHRIVLVIESQPEDYDSTQLLALIRTRLTSIETPKVIYFKDELARTATGKLKR